MSERPANPSQPPPHPRLCSEDKAELILSGRVRPLSRSSSIRQYETNVFGQPGSRALSVIHTGHLSSRQRSPQKDHAGSIHPVLRRLASEPEGPGRKPETSGVCKPRVCGGKVLGPATCRTLWGGQQPAPSPCPKEVTNQAPNSRMITEAQFSVT